MKIIFETDDVEKALATLFRAGCVGSIEFSGKPKRRYVRKKKPAARAPARKKRVYKKRAMAKKEAT